MQCVCLRGQCLGGGVLVAGKDMRSPAFHLLSKERRHREEACRVDPFLLAVTPRKKQSNHKQQDGACARELCVDLRK